MWGGSSLQRIMCAAVLAIFMGAVGGIGRTSAETGDDLWWVFFTDRGEIDTSRAVAAKKTSSSYPKVLSRRARVLGADRIIDERDLPVNPAYIDAVAKHSGGIKTVTRWFNGVTAVLDESGRKAVGALPFVREVRRVAVATYRYDPDATGESPARGAGRAAVLSYGDSYDQLSLIAVPPVHQLGFLGAGIRIAVFDSGFNRLQHTAFDSMYVEEKWDFVDGDDDITGDDHGTQVLSVISALHKGNMIGAAPYSIYMLARTEIVDNGLDHRFEEQNWIAAAEWADSLGVDVINSSLGYIDFSDSTAYTHEDLDGDTALTTIAADIAASKGIVVVTSAGNEGDKPWKHPWVLVSTPADADSVISVGSVDRYGVVSGFSSRGPTYDGRVKPEVMALGEYVLVADTEVQDGYTYKSGTSLAAPAVSGAAALLLEANEDWTAWDVREVFILTAKDRGIAGPDSLYGYGIADTMKASGLTPSASDETSFTVYDPYPQPIVFNSTTPHLYFPMYIPDKGATLLLRIFTFNGESVKMLDYTIPGSGVLVYDDVPKWDGTNEQGEDVAPGVYFYTARLMGYGTHTGKILVMR